MLYSNLNTEDIIDEVNYEPGRQNSTEFQYKITRKSIDSYFTQTFVKRYSKQYFYLFIFSSTHKRYSNPTDSSAASWGNTACRLLGR